MAAMMIVIPTRGRIGRQRTLRKLPPDIAAAAYLVCPESEMQGHRLHHSDVNIVQQPDPGWTIARKRKWILEELSDRVEKVVMLDDDLDFQIRRTDNPKRFLKATHDNIRQAFRELEEQLCPEVPHAGMTARGGSISDGAALGGWQRIRRMMYVLGYHRPTLLANAELGRIETREDMDVTLQLLRKGLPNSVSFSYTCGQGGFGDKGGCTNERTLERSNADAMRLAELFPGYVRVVEKKYLNSPNRLEVVCAWKKAYEDALRERGAQQQPAVADAEALAGGAQLSLFGGGAS